jgi:phosphate-selective porin
VIKRRKEEIETIKEELRKMKKIFTMALCTLALSVSAQEEPATDVMKEKIIDLEGKIASIEEPFIETKATAEKLAKFKFSGYVQSQYRLALGYDDITDSTGKYKAGVGDFSGGKFSEGISNLFQVRRGRLKLAYQGNLSEAVVQIDITQSGTVGVKDAYLSFKDPIVKSVGLKMGVFDRPFGFEISYSSSSRETPERSRLFQTLFPGERDVGVQLEIAPDEMYGALNMLNIKAGLFNGNGIANENDDKKDFIGRVGFKVPFNDINLAVDGGVSVYAGNIVCVDTNRGSSVDSLKRGFSYSMGDTGFVKSTVGKFNEAFERSNFGVDLQVYYDLPVIGGFSLRGEYIQGLMPGTSSSSKPYSQSSRSVSAPVYERNFAGYYVMYIQNLFSKNQLVVKYDVFDPNTDIAGSEIKNSSTTKLSEADLAYGTLGLGLVHHWDANLKFVLYYEMVSNETSTFGTTESKYKIYNEDLKDDVLTARIQYKF